MGGIDWIGKIDGSRSHKDRQKASRRLFETYRECLSRDFETNKRIIDEVAEIQTKRLRNKIAGFTTHLVKQFELGPVRGFMPKLQGGSSEKAKPLETHENENIAVDNDTAEMLHHLLVE